MSKQDVFEIVLKPMRAVFSPPSQMAKDDEAAALEEYAAALSRFDARDLAEGWKRIRESHKRAFWPPIAMIAEACSGARRMRQDSSPKRQVIQARMVDGHVQPWGGACRCRRCVERRPTDGFFRASDEQYAQDAATRNDLAYDLERKIGRDPKIGDTRLDNTLERQRRPEELAALLASTRARYPRTFNASKAEFADERKPVGYIESDPDILQEMRERMASKVVERDLHTHQQDAAE